MTMAPELTIGLCGFNLSASSKILSYKSLNSRPTTVTGSEYMMLIRFENVASSCLAVIFVRHINLVVELMEAKMINDFSVPLESSIYFPYPS